MLDNLRDFLWVPVENGGAVKLGEPLFRPGSKTRFAALIAFAASLASLIAVLWLWFAVLRNSAELRAARLDHAIGERFDSIAAAAAVGRLDVLSMLLAVMGIIAAVALIYAGTIYRAAAISAAKEETERLLPSALKDYLRGDGSGLVRDALKDPELLAAIQRGFKAVGIDDTEDAEADLIEKD